MMRVVAIAALLALCSLTGASQSCAPGQWHPVGARTLYCPGGVCSLFGSRFHLSGEPQLFATDSATNDIQDGDVLVAVNNAPVTTAAGSRALATAAAGEVLELTIRRRDVRREVRARAADFCERPILYSGVTRMAPTAARPADSPAQGPVIDLTQPRELPGLGTDQSLGMTVTCPGCAMDVRGTWTLTSYPSVGVVLPGSVADEAGLRSRDELRMIDGRDILTAGGTRVLFDPPRRDFTIRFLRSGREREARMNLRIVSRRIVRAPDARIVIRRENRISVDGLKQWMAGLGDRRARWEPPGWGASLVGNDQGLFAAPLAGSSAHFVAFPTVASVTPDEPAARAGIRTGDVITTVSGRSLLAPDAIRGMILTGRTRTLSVHVMRADSSFTTYLFPR